jgi:hypothetical protein
LSTNGEPVFLYCIEASGNQKPLLAFNYGGSFIANGLDAYGLEESGLPDTLNEFGVVQLPKFRNYLYVGESSLPDDQLKAQVMMPENWNGTDTKRYALSDLSGASSRTYYWGTTTTMTAMAVAIIGMLV